MVFRFLLSVYVRYSNADHTIYIIYTYMACILIDSSLVGNEKKVYLSKFPGTEINEYRIQITNNKTLKLKEMVSIHLHSILLKFIHLHRDRLWPYVSNHPTFNTENEKFAWH